ncbi:hypothetical protein Spla01_03492 [Streptomyces platensis]
MVGHHAVLAEERLGEVVRVRVVRDPALDIGAEPAGAHALLVLLGGQGAHLGLEQSAGVELLGDLLEGRDGAGAEAVGGGPQRERHLAVVAGGAERFLRLVRLRTVAVGVEEGGAVARDAGRDDRVQRHGGALVDVPYEGRAVQEVGDRLADAELAGDRVLEVEDQVHDLGAGALDDLGAVLLLQRGVVQLRDVLHGQTAVGDVDIAALDGLLERAGGVEELHGHPGVLDLGRALVGAVDGEDGLLGAVGLEGVDAGADGLAVGAQPVGGVLGVVDDGAGARGYLHGEGRVGRLQPEDHGLGVRGLDLVERGEHHGGAVLVLDAPGAVEGVLDVLGRQVVAVAEGETVLQGAAVDLALPVGETAALGGFRLGGGASLGEAQQGLEDVVEQQPRAGLVTGRGVGRHDLVRHSHDHGLAVAGRSRVVRAAPGDREQSCRQPRSDRGGQPLVTLPH